MRALPDPGPDGPRRPPAPVPPRSSAVTTPRSCGRRSTGPRRRRTPRMPSSARSRSTCAGSTRSIRRRSCPGCGSSSSTRRWRSAAATASRSRLSTWTTTSARPPSSDRSTTCSPAASASAAPRRRSAASSPTRRRRSCSRRRGCRTPRSAKGWAGPTRRSTAASPRAASTSSRTTPSWRPVMRASASRPRWRPSPPAPPARRRCSTCARTSATALRAGRRSATSTRPGSAASACSGRSRRSSRRCAGSGSGTVRPSRRRATHRAGAPPRPDVRDALDLGPVPHLGPDDLEPVDLWELYGAVERIDPAPLHAAAEVPGRWLELKSHLYTWFHRLSGTDVVAATQISAGTGGGRIATLGAVVGFCLSGLGAGTVCVVTGVVELPLSPAPKEVRPAEAGTEAHARAEEVAEPRAEAPTSPRRDQGAGARFVAGAARTTQQARERPRDGDKRRHDGVKRPPPPSASLISRARMAAGLKRLREGRTRPRGPHRQRQPHLHSRRRYSK